jgi:hypothetical protein
MANLMFGWSAQDLFMLIQTCDRFFEAYRNGPGGARTHLKNFAEQVENCKQILTLIQTELQKQDREFFRQKVETNLSPEHTGAMCEDLRQIRISEAPR